MEDGADDENNDLRLQVKKGKVPVSVCVCVCVCMCEARGKRKRMGGGGGGVGDAKRRVKGREEPAVEKIRWQQVADRRVCKMSVSAYGGRRALWKDMQCQSAMATQTGARHRVCILMLHEISFHPLARQ